jgi:formylglycine-generating enzyme required for sulfatase activity
LGRDALKGKEVDRAIAEFNAGLKLSPDTTALFYLGQAYQLKGDKPSALKAYADSLALDANGPVAADVRKAQAELQASAAAPSPKQITEAQKLLKGLGVYAGPEDGKSGAKTEAAVKSFQRENGIAADGVLGEALLAKLRSVASDRRAKAEAYFRDGLAALKANNASGAIGGFEAGLKLASDAEAEFYLGEALRVKGDTAEALKHYKRSVEIDPHSKVAGNARDKQTMLGSASSNLSPPAASAREVGASFRDCSDCPEMVVIPAGSFTMGAATGEEEREGVQQDNRGRSEPRHDVRVKGFAAGRYEVTFAEWDACVAAGGCSERAEDKGWGRGNRPVMNVNWNDAKQYVAWLSRKTGKWYRLLTEAEWEYAARAGTTSARYWGEAIGSGNANCDGCGSQWDNRQTAPVGSFKPNAFGLHDMLGNVWEWVEDCWNGNYMGAPTDGSAWQAGQCGQRVLRGGSWFYDPRFVRAAYRHWFVTAVRGIVIGFRVARTE